jgi:hypothetical protein
VLTLFGRVFCKTQLIRKFTNPNIPESQLVRISEALLYLDRIREENRRMVKITVVATVLHPAYTFNDYRTWALLRLTSRGGTVQ